MKVQIIRILTLCLLPLLAACNLSTASQPAATPAPVVTTEPTQPDTLATYTNTAYGYTLQYPVGLALDGDATSQFVWIDRQLYIMVSDLNPEQPRGDAPIIETAADVMIGTFTARRLSGYIGAVGGNTPQRYESLVIQHNNLIYQFIAYELKNNDIQPVDRAMNPVPPAALALLDQIVASLQFNA